MGNPKSEKIVWLEHIGWISTLLFSLSAWISPSIASITGMIMGAALVLNFRQAWPIMRSDPMFRLFVVFMGYMLFTAAYSTYSQPETDFDHLDAIWRFGTLFLFGPLAFWLKSDLKRVFWVIGLGGLSLVVGLLLCVDWAFWVEAMQGQRIPLTRWGLITMGLFASVGLLGVLMFGPRIFNYLVSRLTYIPGLTLILLLVAFFFQMILISQSRTVWIGVLVFTPPLLFARYWSLLKGRTSHKSFKGTIIPALLIAAALALILVHSYPNIADRLRAEHADFKRLAQLETEGYNQYGFGVRVLLNIYGYQKWKEKPVLGWGPGANLKEFNHNHLHNTYLEIMVRFGVVGIILLAIYTWLLLRALFWSRSNRRMPFDLWLFIAGVYALTAFFCLTDFRLTQMDFRRFWIILAAIGYTFYLYGRQNIGTKDGDDSAHSK